MGYNDISISHTHTKACVSSLRIPRGSHHSNCSAGVSYSKGLTPVPLPQSPLPLLEFEEDSRQWTYRKNNNIYIYSIIQFLYINLKINLANTFQDLSPNMDCGNGWCHNGAAQDYCSSDGMLPWTDHPSLWLRRNGAMRINYETTNSGTHYEPTSRKECDEVFCIMWFNRWINRILDDSLLNAPKNHV